MTQSRRWDLKKRRREERKGKKKGWGEFGNLGIPKENKERKTKKERKNCK